jgi:SAM-dependent methyltransferase
VLARARPRTILCGMEASIANPPTPDTLWEQVARTRWGHYLSSAEESALNTAAASAHVGSALEIGCDGGRWSQMLASLGWSVTCVDVREEAVELCRTRMPFARCLLVASDEESFPVPAGSVDLLLVYEVPPVTNSEWFAAEAARVLKPGGVLACTISNPASLRGAVYRVRMPLSASRRKNKTYAGPSYREVWRTLEAQRFDLLFAEGLGWAPFSRGSDSRLITGFTRLEKVLGLRRLVRFSPLVIVVAKRS